MPETIHDILRESLEVRIAFSKQLAKIATRIRHSAQTAQASSHIGVNEQMERDLPQGETLNTTNTYKQYTLGSLLLFKHVHTASPLHNAPQLQRHLSRQWTGIEMRMYRSSKEYKIRTKFNRDLTHSVKHSGFRHSSFCPSGVKHDCGFGILVAELVSAPY